MKFENVTSLTQQALAQSMGADYMEKLGNISELSSYQLADVGRDVADSGSVEKFTNSLISLLGKQVWENREYTARVPSIMIDAFEWGGFLERTIINLTDIMDDPMFSLVDGKDYSDIEHKFYQPKAVTKIFQEGKAIMTAISIQTEALKEAFHSWEGLNGYISAIRQKVINTLNLAIEQYTKMLLSCAVAVSDKATNTAIDLAKSWRDLHAEDANTSVSELNRNPEYIKYCIQQINLVREYIKDYSTAYNNGNQPMFATDSKLVLLKAFEVAVNTARSGIFNKELSAIDGKYDTITAWQGITTNAEAKTDTYNFDNVSSIKISADPNNKLGIGTGAYSVSGVVGLCFDPWALGMTINRSKVTSSYTACADFWNEFHHHLLNYILDSNFAIVAFIESEPSV